jgi:hypothetical protein
MKNMTRLLEFLTQLEQRKIHYTLEHNRKEAIMVLIAVPGERWEVEFFADSEVEFFADSEVEFFADSPVEVEVFRSIGMSVEEELERLFREYSD